MLKESLLPLRKESMKRRKEEREIENPIAATS